MSNSSSTSYTVWLPDWVEFKKLFNEFDFKEFTGEDEPEELQNIKENTIEVYKQIQKNKAVGDDESGWSEVLEILEKGKYIICEAESGCGGYSSMININTPETRKKLELLMKEGSQKTL